MTTPTATRDMPRPGADSNAKRAAKVADLIVEDVMALGWPVGEVLGSETDLLERYEVSRAVFREAVRLVEHQGVARTRRGPGGGLVITEPTVGAVIDAVVLYLHRVDARLDEIFEARIILEEIACQLASERTDENDLAELRRFADDKPVDPGGDPREFHALVASISGNSGLELFVDVFNRVAQLYSPDWQRLGSGVAAETRHAHSMIAEAIMAGDAGLARNRMRKHLQAEADFFRRRRSTRQLLPDSVVLAQSGQGKGAEVVARNITQTIVTEGLQPGELVGTEPELIEREGVSRALLREAVRLLEHHQIARMRRGPGGGLFVMAPSANAVTEVAAIYLVRRGMQLADLAELRTGVEVAITDLAAARIDDVGTAGLDEALAREANATDAERVEAVHDLHAAVAAAAQNRVLHLVALVLIRLSRLYQIERLAPKTQKQIKDEVLRTHEGIARAIEDGDRELARHRMRRHLEALGALMR
ncbi:MAG: FCD domain-containing protein [Acidimicrobiales bacterium]|jgi:DNA-binding FadR family transcriptional regulator